MWGSQIWPQNSNHITFDPLFGKTKLENLLTQYFCQFQFFFVKKGIKCYAIWVLRTDLEYSHHFTYFRPLNVITFHISILWPNTTILKFSKSHVRSFFQNLFLTSDSESAPQRHNNGWCGDRFAEKMVITPWPNELSGIFFLEGEWVRRVLPHRKHSSRVPMLGISITILKKVFRRHKNYFIFQ